MLDAQPAGNAPGHSPMTRQVTVAFSQTLLGDALTTLRREFGVALAWSGDVLPSNTRVSLHATDAALASVLGQLLAGTGLATVVASNGTVVIVPARLASDAPRTEPTETRNAAVAHSLIATGVAQLDRIVVMGSPVRGSPEREQPTAIHVVTNARLRETSHSQLSDVVRTELPGLVLWDRGPTGPPAPFASVRGVASFTTRAIKTYVDGIELASPELFTLLDGRSIERMEMIRGPQGAALYGPDALNGILQIQTRRGRIGQSHLSSRLFMDLGSYERDGLADWQPTQRVSAAVTGGNRRAAFDISGALANVGRDATRQLQSHNMAVGANAVLGTVVMQLSARSAQYEYVSTPRGTAASREAIPQQIEERAVAWTAMQQVSERWRHTLVVGQHWIQGDREPFRSPILPPRLPGGATFETASRTSARYASTLAFTPSVELSGGAELSTRHVDRIVRRSATISDLSTLSRDDVRSAGAFLQSKIHVGSHVVLSGGTRGERLSSIGTQVGTVWAATAGTSWHQEFQYGTARLRGAWGRGIRPPEPGMSTARTTSTIRQLPNTALAPERQHGVEVGADLFLANGAFVKATWYQQHATDLIQQVSRRTPTDMSIYQFQNIGVVRNTGVELEGGVRLPRITAAATLHIPRSEVRQLSPSYTGELLPGDQLIEVPESSGSAYVRYAAHESSVAAGTTWSMEFGATVLGAWTGYDWQLLARIENGLATRRDVARDYWKRYPGLVRPYVQAAVNTRGPLRVTLRVDNLGLNSAFIRDNLSPPLGRTVTLGVALPQISWR